MAPDVGMQTFVNALARRCPETYDSDAWSGAALRQPDAVLGELEAERMLT
jgi:hypothetical protein